MEVIGTRGIVEGGKYLNDKQTRYHNAEGEDLGPAEGFDDDGNALGEVEVDNKKSKTPTPPTPPVLPPA